MTGNLIFVTILLVGVVLVNGWTDAPNAIATAVATKCMKMNTAVILSAFCNFAGVLVMTAVNAGVARTVSGIAGIGGGQEGLKTLASGLIAIIVFSVGAWFFGIPTSESHALLAGVTGAAIGAGGIGAVHMGEWVVVLTGLVISVVAGFLGGHGLDRLIARLLRKRGRNPKSEDRFFQSCSILSAAGMSFLHGAQDGQKFIGIYMMGLMLANGWNSSGEFNIPIEVIIICSVAMTLGTAIGGKRIIETVGVKMVRLEKQQGFAADLGSCITLLCCSLAGIPVSTTHTKTAAVMGAGIRDNSAGVDKRIVREMLAAWCLTFPVCGIIGFLMQRIL